MNVKLIVTYGPTHQKSCEKSLKNVMDAVGAKPKFLKSKYSGIFLPPIIIRKNIYIFNIFSWFSHHGFYRFSPLAIVFII